MRVRIDGEIRGDPIRIEWVGGAIVGDLELAERARRLYLDEHGVAMDESDPAAVIAALEEASPEHLHVEILPDADDDRSGRPSRS